MLAKKQTLINLTFVLISLTLILYSFTQDWDGGAFKDYDNLDNAINSSQETYFKNIDYFLLKKEKPNFSLKALELVTNNTSKKTFFFDPDGHVFLDNGEKVFFNGDRGIYDQNIEKLVLNGDVEVKTGDTIGNSEQMIYESLIDQVHMIGDVKTKMFYPEQGDWIFLDSKEAFLWPDSNKSKFVGDVAGRVKRLRVYEDSLFFWSQILEMDMNIHKANLYKDVRMRKSELDASSRRGEIFLENYNKKVKYYALYDDVKLNEKINQEGKIITRKAFSEKLEGLPSEDRVILTGYPKVYQLNDVIKGNKIVLRQSTEVVEVDDANTKFQVE